MSIYIDRETYYTPHRVKTLLPYLSLLADGRFPRRTDEEQGHHRRIKLNQWAGEHAVCVHADLTAALDALPWFTRSIVYLACVDGKALMHVAREVGCDWETAGRRCESGVLAVAKHLGYVPRPAEEYDASPTVWRKEAA